ncbi:MAG: hypothetical protein JXB35_16920 [Anaerolineae bacterium]|nr:hypothetical protein [Anaerolineae bacterium]
MATLPPNPTLTRFIKPTLDTPFHIDYEWWHCEGLDLNVELLSHLCPEHRIAFSGQPLGEKIDWIDWTTGEVKRVEGLQYLVSTHCSKQPGFISQAPTLIESIFRVFLNNGNQPQTPAQLAQLVGYPEDQILRMLSGRWVRKGLRPVLR